MKKILVIDDETDICTMLKDYLQLEGYLVYTAESRPETLSLMNIGPDLILLDINMPGMDGYEVCARIREHVFCPIIFLSARVEDDGPGFSAGGLEHAATLYWTESSQSGCHFGMDLYICSKLCEKHGGILRHINKINGGAIVSAEFKTHISE